jgi:hypothetical protein
VAKSLLGRLFGRADPTADWPPFAGAVPKFDLERLALGPVRLGDPFEAARALGKPQAFDGDLAKGKAFLEYGLFDLDFRDGKLMCVGFDVLAAEAPVGGLRLSGSTTPETVRGWFGEPKTDGVDGGFRWIEYQRGGATLEFEFGSDGRLGYVQVYLDGYT